MSRYRPYWKTRAAPEVVLLSRESQALATPRSPLWVDGRVEQLAELGESGIQVGIRAFEERCLFVAARTTAGAFAMAGIEPFDDRWKDTAMRSAPF